MLNKKESLFSWSFRSIFPAQRVIMKLATKGDYYFFTFLLLIAVTTLTGLPLWILLIVKTVSDAITHKKTDHHVEASTEYEEKKFIEKAILP